MTKKLFTKYLFLLASCVGIFGWQIVNGAGNFDFNKNSGLDAMANMTGHPIVSGSATPDSVGEFISSYAGQIINMVVSLVGAIFLLVMIYGGFTWMTAQGDEKKTTKAKEMIVAAIIGLVFILSAYLITAFIGSQMKTWKQ